MHASIYIRIDSAILFHRCDFASFVEVCIMIVVATRVVAVVAVVNVIVALMYLCVRV